MQDGPSRLPSLPWQRPNATEAHAAEQLSEWQGAVLQEGGAAYLPFAWATWIDLARDRPAPPAPLNAGPAQQLLATVGQHIEMLQHIGLLRRCGVTDLFWSHATTGLHHHQGVRIHPFPLFPVRCTTHPAAAGGLPSSERRWLYSFQGVDRPDLYLTRVREWILNLPPRPDALVESRREWHFEQQVYREQVHGEPADAARHAELRMEADSFAATLQQSVFALCPSGSGPNSIRLWEALGYGAIPVILADSLALPGDAELWCQASVRVAETPEALAALPGQLEALRRDQARLRTLQAAGQQLWLRYGPGDFVADLRTFLADPDGALVAAALNRLGNPENPIQLCACQAASLPLDIARLLRNQPPERPLLVTVQDSAPLPLLEARWRTPLTLCRRLVGRRAWAISCRSPKLEQLASPQQS
jgi:hypothetical protein